MKKKRLPKDPRDQTLDRSGAEAAKSEVMASWMFGLAAVTCVTILAYWPALHGGILWDDDQHVTRLELQSLHGLWRIWSDLRTTQQYYPLLFSAFWVEHRLWGDAVLGYHLTNVAFHSLSALLVVLIVQRLKLAGAWVAGLVFALHPVCVESVAWITEQKNTMSGVFYLAATLAYLHFDETRRKSARFLAPLFLVRQKNSWVESGSGNLPSE
jgi:protein O-mannosyl-transferase